MTITERRKHPRTKVDNTVSYICIDDSENKIADGMGRAIDISEGGILIETHNPIETQDILLPSLDVKDDSISIKGRVLYYITYDFEKFHAGIQFFETKEKIISFTTNLIKAYIKLTGTA